MQGCGGIAIQTANYSILTNENPTEVSRAASLIESLQGIGLSLGPVIGGLLFDFGGFASPFIFLGVLFLFLCIPSSILISQ